MIVRFESFAAYSILGVPLQLEEWFDPSESIIANSENVIDLNENQYTMNEYIYAKERTKKQCFSLYVVLEESARLSAILTSSKKCSPSLAGV